MIPETRSRLLHYLVRFHFAYLIAIVIPSARAEDTDHDQ